MGFRDCFVGTSCALAAILVGVEFHAEAASFTPGQSGSVIVSLASSGTGLFLTQSGNNNTQGALTLSADKPHLLLTGFNAPIGNPNVAGTGSSTVLSFVASASA